MLIPTTQNVRNITDFRKDPDSILESIQGKTDPLYLFRGSEPKAVVLDIEEFARMQQIMEDYQEYQLISEIASDPNRRKDGINLDELKEKYNLKTNAKSNS